MVNGDFISKVVERAIVVCCRFEGAAPHAVNHGYLAACQLVQAKAETWCTVASSPGHSHFSSCSRGGKSGEGLGTLLDHGSEMVDLASAN